MEIKEEKGWGGGGGNSKLSIISQKNIYFI